MLKIKHHLEVKKRNLNEKADYVLFWLINGVDIKKKSQLNFVLGDIRT